uniref:Uncharacterized protein n=1 Tax=Florenciella sp. virus SA2 TaxID=3240092 RepID=A0AB39JEA0_9VIRU
MNYTKSDLQLSEKSLYEAIIQVVKAGKKTNSEIEAKLLSNFNTYDETQLTNMLNRFQSLLVNSIVECGEDTLNIDYVVDNKMKELTYIIY